MAESQFRSIERVAVEYLGGLSPAKRASDEAAILRFVRWFGRQRGVDAIKARDIDAYCATAPLQEAPALRAFLSYTYKKGLSIRGLATHVKARKEPKEPARTVSGPDDPIQVSDEGLYALRAELEDLKEQRIVVTEQMKRAAADKDFRENAPLQAAREQKSHIEGRIKELETTLSRATRVNGRVHQTAVCLGDTVHLKDLANGNLITYKLVDSREASPARGKLSSSSPIGRAIMGKHVGQEVEFSAPAGIFTYRIEEITPHHVALTSNVASCQGSNPIPHTGRQMA
jgi:transcription elongation factor GreA